MADIEEKMTKVMTEAQQAVLLAPSYNRPAVGDQAYAKL